MTARSVNARFFLASHSLAHFVLPEFLFSARHAVSTYSIPSALDLMRTGSMHSCRGRHCGSRFPLPSGTVRPPRLYRTQMLQIQVIRLRVLPTAGTRTAKGPGPPPPAGDRERTSRQGVVPAGEPMSRRDAVQGLTAPSSYWLTAGNRDRRDPSEGRGAPHVQSHSKEMLERTMSSTNAPFPPNIRSWLVLLVRVAGSQPSNGAPCRATKSCGGLVCGRRQWSA